MELLVIIIVLALIFDYINGFHDAANSIATIVSTKVLTPFQAVIWAAFFNFVAFFIAKCIIGGFGHSQYCIENGSRVVYYITHHLGGSDSCHCLESVYLVEGHSFVIIAYVNRRFCGSGHHGSRL